MTVARALLLLACTLLVVPGIFIGAKGLATIRRGSAVVQGRTVTGGKAVGAGLILLGWAAGMILFAVLVATAQLRR
jgi:hypothetical protein